jgi:N-acetylglucosaminyl-diphospho-decaprenol L-rhamnosyltransferase
MAVGSVIIVSYNSESYIEACLLALESVEGWKVILVDNCSTDHTVERAKQVGGKICMLLNPKNLGFAAAVNQGAKVAEGDVFVVLNPDTISSPYSLEKLAQAVTACNVGAAGGLLVPNGAPAESGFTVRRFPTLGSMLVQVLLVNHIWPGNPWNRDYQCLDLNYRLAQEVEQPAGACLAVKRKAWEVVGGFDEDFFPVWFEDVDFCRRLRSKGWKIVYRPDAVFAHAGGHSVNKLRFEEKQVFWYRNLLRYFAKHHSRAELGLLQASIVIGLLFRMLLSLCGLQPAGVSVREAIRAYWHVARRCATRRTNL